MMQFIGKIKNFFTSNNELISTVDAEFEALLTGLRPDLIEILRKIHANDKNLKTLCLVSQDLDSSFTKALAVALKTNFTLTYLDLTDNDIGDAGAKDIAIALETNFTLTHLDLKDNDIGDAGAEYLAEMLKINQKLAHLEVSLNAIEAAGVKYIAAALRDNKTLTFLDLGGSCNSNIQNESAKYIVAALSVNNTLTHFIFDWRNIGDAGAKEFAKVLIINSTLIHLDLVLNHIGDAGAIAILGALKDHNTTVTNIKLNVNHNSIQTAVNNSIYAAFERNNTFKKQIDAITKPLYELDKEGFPAWQTKPLAKAIDLDNKIKNFIKLNPLSKKLKLVQELYGLKYLCLAHYYYNVYLCDKENNQEVILKLVSENLSLAEVMGYHAPLVYQIAQADINETKTPHHREFLDAQLLPGQAQRKALCYGYNRLKLERALNRQPEPTEEELKNAPPLKSVALRG